jgi:predicted ThiF/HesA family dinucleotide-utilizing enzyme
MKTMKRTMKKRRMSMSNTFPEVQRQIFQRQEPLHTKVPEVATVVGVGGIGFWIALDLAMLGTKELVLIDPDRIEISNLNRIPLSLKNIGRSKVLATKEFITDIRPDCRIEAIPDRVEDHLGEIKGYVFICVDDFDVASLVVSSSQASGLPYIVLTYDGRHFTITKEVNSCWEVEARRGYRVIPSYVITPQMVSLIALVMIDLGKTMDISESLEGLIEKLSGRQT